jgi:hypothetical protein
MACEEALFRAAVSQNNNPLYHSSKGNGSKMEGYVSFAIANYFSVNFTEYC